VRAAFVQANNDRYKDARALIKAGRWGGAIYVGGYVIECLLKAGVLRRLRQIELPREHWHHDLDRLLDVAWLRAPLKLPQNREVNEAMTLITLLWDVTMRYGVVPVGRHQARKFLDAVRKVRSWLLVLLRSPRLT